MRSCPLTKFLNISVLRLCSLIEAALEDAWQELSKDGNTEATLARKKLRTTIVALASVGETDHRKLKRFAINAWRGAMQAEHQAIGDTSIAERVLAR